MAEKVGILGGAFNPPHEAHLALARAALKELKLDFVFFIPTRNAPHKSIDGDMSPSARSLLIKLAAFTVPPEQLSQEIASSGFVVRDLPGFIESYRQKYKTRHDDRIRVSDIEMQRKSVSYTIDTIRSLQEIQPAWSLFIIIGMDQAVVFDTWKDWQILPSLARIYAADRNGIDRNLVAEKFPFIHFFKFPKTDLSSTQLRKNLKSGHIPEGSIPEIVRDFLSRTKVDS